jgi:hypothetical protein
VGDGTGGFGQNATAITLPAMTTTTMTTATIHQGNGRAAGAAARTWNVTVGPSLNSSSGFSTPTMSSRKIAAGRSRRRRDTHVWLRPHRKVALRHRSPAQIGRQLVQRPGALARESGVADMETVNAVSACPCAFSRIVFDAAVMANTLVTQHLDTDDLGSCAAAG